MLSKLSIKLIANIRWCSREAYSQMQHQFFFIAEMCTVFKSRQIIQLLFRDPDFSAHGRMNVDSKWAAYHRRNFKLDQLF